MDPKEIIKQRTDMSEYLFHFTSESRFWSILEAGYLKATYAPRGGIMRPTIYGPYPAACFSEMPISNFFQSLIESRYWQSRWFIVLPKQVLYKYGGRPVLYGDLSFKDRLQPEDKYLFSHFNPNELTDWSHEREWRVKPDINRNQKIYPQIVPTTKTMVPIHLDESGNPLTEKSPTVEPRFILIVEQEKDKEKLNQKIFEWVSKFLKGARFSDYRQSYLIALGKAKVFSLEYIKDTKAYDIADLISPTATESAASKQPNNLWDDWQVETRQQVIEALREQLPFKFRTKLCPLKYLDWQNVPEEVKEIVRRSNEPRHPHSQSPD